MIKEGNDIAHPGSEILKMEMNPFPGLRPFEVEESHLFFGREGQSDEVVHKLMKHRFIAVMGASGSGKSSLMNCGVIPKLHSGLYFDNEKDWDVIVTKPGTSPLENLAESILSFDEKYQSASEEDKSLEKIFATSILRSSSLGLIDLINSSAHFQNKNTFILIDQFEELFRFQIGENHYDDANETTAFINLLMEAINYAGSLIHVSITIRSDYSGNFAQYPEITKKINSSHYLIPQMSRSQRRRAIEGPVAVGGGRIAPRLVRELLNDVEDDPDQLPIIQHALMRTWNFWVESNSTNEPIDIKHYEAIGTIKQALSQHANEIYDELDEQEKLICESLFKTITEKGNDDHGVRRPTRLDLVAAIAGAEEEKLISVIEKFRKSGKSLLMPPEDIVLTSRSIIDVSHESLIRIWGRLHHWVSEEHEAIDMYLRLSDAAKKYQKGLTTLWRPPDLHLALNWHQKYNPTLVWAQRFAPAFERAMVFLQSSHEAYEIEVKNKEAQQKRRLRATRILTLIFGIIAIFSILLMVYGFSQQLEAEKNRQLALKEKAEVEVQRNVAISLKEQEAELKKRAIVAQKTAEDQKNVAKKQEQIAIFNEELAKEQAELAENRRIEAVKAKRYAEGKEVEAGLQRDEATRQRNIAEDRRVDAYNLRLLSIARAMAIKSLKENEPELKSLLALQAFDYNNKYGGFYHDYDVYDGLYSAYKALKGDSVNQLFGHQGSVRSMVFNHDGSKLYTTSGDGKVLKWDFAYGSNNYELLGDNGRNDFSNRVLVLSKDEKWLISGHDASYIDIYDLKNGNNKSRKMQVHNARIWDLAYMPDNSGFISVGADSTVKFSDLNNLVELTRVSSKVNKLEINPVGDIIALAQEDGNLIFVNRKNNHAQTLVYSSENNQAIRSIKFNSKGNLLAIGEDGGMVHIYDMENKRMLASLPGFSARVNDLEFSNDDTMLGAVAFDGSARIWFVDYLNTEPIVLQDHNDWIWSLKFSPDGKYLLTGAVNSQIRIFPTDPAFLAETFCDHLTRNMNADEWYKFVDKNIEYNFTCPGLPIGKSKIKEY